MQPRPDVVVLDVNETLSDMAPLAQLFEQSGAPAQLARTWFASVLRDGFGLAAAGASARFTDIAADLLRSLLREAGVTDVAPPPSASSAASPSSTSTPTSRRGSGACAQQGSRS